MEKPSTSTTARTFLSGEVDDAASSSLSAPLTALSATALEVVAFEYATSLGRRGEIGVEHAAFAARQLTDSRLDLLATSLWVQYLLVGAYVSRTTVRATPAACHTLLSRILSDAYLLKTDTQDAQLAEELVRQNRPWKMSGADRRHRPSLFPAVWSDCGRRGSHGCPPSVPAGSDGRRSNHACPRLRAPRRPAPPRPDAARRDARPRPAEGRAPRRGVRGRADAVRRRGCF